MIRTLPVVLLSLISSHVFANQVDVSLVYEVSQEKPRSMPLGTIRIGLSSDCSNIVSITPGIEEHVLYTKRYCISRLVSKDSNSAEIRPSVTTGKVQWLPVLPNGVLLISLVREASLAAGSKTRAEVADPAVLAYGNALQFEPAEVERIPTNSANRPSAYKVQHEGKASETWAYSGYRTVGGRTFPARITHDRFKAGGLNIPADDRMVWDLTSASVVTSGTIPSELTFLPNGTTVQDNRDSKNPVAFTYNPQAGSLEEQARIARSAQASRPVTAGSESSASGATLPIVVALVGVVIGLVAYLRKSRTRQ